MKNKRFIWQALAFIVCALMFSAIVGSGIAAAADSQVEEVIKRVEELKEVDTKALTSKDGFTLTKINSAKSLYDALTPDQKSQVSQETTSLLNALSKSAENVLKAYSAEYYISQIGTVTKEKAGAINIAQQEFDSLTTEQKALVPNKKDLDDAQTAYEKLAGAKAGTAEDNLKRALSLVDALKSSDLGSEKTISDTSAVFTDLSQDQRVRLSNDLMAYLSGSQTEEGATGGTGNAPKTGDQSNIALNALYALESLLAIALLWAVKKRVEIKG